MKKYLITLLAVLAIAVCFTGCGKEDIPALLVDDTPAVALAAYDPEKISNEIEPEMVEAVNTEYPFDVPDNYRHVQDYVFAELNDNSEIIGFKIAVQQNDQSWKWEDCDSQGNIIEETTTQTETTTQEETTRRSSSSSSGSSETTTKKETTTKRSSSSSSSSGSSGSFSSSNSSGSNSSNSRPAITSAPPTQQAFTWKIINQSSCPVSVSNKFDNYILKRDAATVSASSGGSTYALIKAPTGQGVSVHSVSESGKISYSFTSSGSNYVIVSINRTVSVSFSKS